MMPTFNQHKKDLVKALETVVVDFMKRGFTTFDTVEAISYAANEIVRYDPKLTITVEWLAKETHGA